MSSTAVERRSLAQAVRDVSRGVQDSLDGLAERSRPGSLTGRVTSSLALHWATAWWMAMTAAAACLAWTVSLYVGLATPVPAAVAAVLTVALSLNQSLRTGMSLVSATAVALVIAYALYQFWGVHVWTVGVLVVSALFVGRLMQLGPEGSLQIPATALFVYVMGAGLTDEVIVDRILATLLGVAVGLVFSFIAHPERPESRLTEKLADLGHRMGALLVEMGSSPNGDCTRRQAATWLTQSRELSLEIAQVGTELDKLRLGKRFSVGSEKVIGEALREQHVLLTKTCEHVGDIAHGLFDATARGDLHIPSALGPMLASTGEALSMHAELLSDSLGHESPPTGVLRALEAVEQERSRSVAGLKDLDDTGALLLGGAVVTEIDRMVSRLGGPPRA